MQRHREEGAAASRRVMARIREIEQRHGELLRERAAELVRFGATTLRTTAGDIHGRLLMFGHQAAVLELVYHGGWSQSQVAQATATEACVHCLASALAQIGPDAEPS